ncbi:MULTISPECIES: glycoside hydrolase family 57 protein [Methanosarcina]|uniref:Alpha-amlyase n=8 Tax=Methanosarcina mazei TaxID=2209 RepID=A0A0F8EX20_METMZ|nr:MULTISPECIES: glycoside hydrolase family 57 protein [Methanosarcina]AAM30557.1 Alpha-amylase [Methanosarcina mazei Go1]AGF96288.1 Alpha-amylase [Methanosarcina mazei Tuc01]AKB39457.1 Alpha-amylase [Methanosarcina mazei WWM610]AKB60425.1 Alpha-amylase [Methanosarcina mazei SarPi]AKB63640.1 Alpha-amylase [Methanosarcina mazei S-6]
MKAVCMCVGVHLPYSPKWYWPVEGFTGVPEMDRYFDRNQIFSRLLKAGREFLRLNDLFIESIERGGSYAFDLSGPFLEQCRWDPEMLESFRELAESRRVEFTGSCNYHSLSALYPDLSWFREEVTIYREMMKELLGVSPETFVNTELLYTQRAGDILGEMGFKCLIAEGSRNILDGYDPVRVFESQLPILLRHINLSEDLELRFSEKSWEGYPLIPDKFADWIAGIEGDVLTLYLNNTSLCLHHRNKSMIADFIRAFPEALKSRGIEMITPSEAVSRFSPLRLPTLGTEQTIRYGMHNAVGNHAQQLYLRELVRVGEELSEIKGKKNYGRLKQIFGYLQQSEILFSMGPGNSREGHERAVNYYSILSDLRRAVLEESA